MKRSAPHPFDISAARQQFDTAQHLARRAVGKRGEHDARRGNALFNEIGDAVGNRARLARACARDNERRARIGCGDRELFLVEFRAITRQLVWRIASFDDVAGHYKSRIQNSEFRMKAEATLTDFLFFWLLDSDSWILLSFVAFAAKGS